MRVVFSNRVMYRRVKELPASNATATTVTTSSYSTIVTLSLLFFPFFSLLRLTTIQGAGSLLFSISFSLSSFYYSSMSYHANSIGIIGEEARKIVYHSYSLLKLSVHTLHATNLTKVVDRKKKNPIREV
jgi:hypothetical protein